jgi:ATP-dependent protease HslVU (ClpYQ) peptidase subunit
MSAEEIVTKALGIAASICVYTNENIIVETLSTNDSTGQSKH